MKATTLVRTAFAALLCGTLFSASCGDIVVNSVKTGLYSFVSGSVASTFNQEQLTNYLTGLFAGGNSSGTNTSRGL